MVILQQLGPVAQAGLVSAHPAQQDNLAPTRHKVNREPEALLQPISGSSSATLSVGNPPSPVVVSSTRNPRHKCQTPRLPVPCSWDLLCTIQSGVSSGTGDSCAHFPNPYRLRGRSPAGHL